MAPSLLRSAMTTRVNFNTIQAVRRGNSVCSESECGRASSIQTKTIVLYTAFVDAGPAHRLSARRDP
jgi:hypothetical protein